MLGRMSGERRGSLGHQGQTSLVATMSEGTEQAFWLGHWNTLKVMVRWIK